MANNANSVNIAKRPGRYHHGDLRAALIAAGLEALSERSLDDLSLREVARKSGVSATAVYRHFPNKQALLRALCDQGAAQLAQAQRTAMAAAGGGAAGFAATGQAYVRFALENPALFRLMMATRPRKTPAEGPRTPVNAAMDLLHQNVASLLPDGATDAEKRAAALAAWAKVHGLAMLILDGQIAADDGVIAAITQQ